LPLADRFHWLVAPRSSIIQTSSVHTGLCTDPPSMLTHLLETMVCPPVTADGASATPLSLVPADGSITSQIQRHEDQV
jgi:hypothetical protein